MTAVAFIALVVAWLLGTLIVAVFWPRVQSWRADLALILAMGVIVGLGATSATFFAASLISNRPALLAGAIDVIGCVGLLWRLRFRIPTHPAAATDIQPASAAAPHRHEASPALQRVLAFIFVQAAVVASVIAWRAYQAEPLGGWDGWAIWNLHARLMLRAGTAWPDLLVAPQLSWTHPDYPLLVPAAVARLWSWAGEEAPLAAAMVAVIFAAATVAILVGIVARRRDTATALVGGIVLLATPFFITFAPNQHADIPLASFMLAAVGLLLLADDTPRAKGMWVLAGLCAGFAAGTKNEGLLFAIVFASAAGILIRRTRLWPAAFSFLGGFALPLLAVALFKLRLAPPNDLLSAPLDSRWIHLVDPGRHVTILASLWRDLGRFGEWLIPPWVALALPFAAWRARRPLTRSELIAPSMLGLMLAGYYSVYLLTPQALAWHLDTSLVRLLLQLWPLAILTWCLAIPNWIRPNSAAASLASWVSNRFLFLAASGLVAAGVVSVLSLQRGTNELVVRRVGRGEVSAMVGVGWFALERHGRDEWAWSSGQATLPLHVNGRKAVGPLTMRCSLRGTGSRTVTVRHGSRVLWEGSVGAQHVPVTISGLVLAPGTTTLEFSTDMPGVAESAAVGGRSLAFALYNLRLE